MSRMATNEYIGAKRRAYAQADRAKRKHILDEVCETTGYERKYANRLLTGSRKFRERKGRGKTYGDDVAAALKKVWREAGCPCLPYFKAEVERWVEEYMTQVAHIRPAIRAKLLAMSDRTMSRLLSGEARVKPGWARGNKRSGRGARNEVKANTPCASGETVTACNVPPGDVQIDTFALGGGDPSDNFFWILDGSDRKTQWTVLCPTWNRGQHATLEALRHIEGKFPFDILALHSDNGGEALNHHVAAYLGSSPSLQDELVKLCDDWSDFRNFFCPCKMLVSKEKRPDGKGHRCRYDKPRTPYRRVLDEHVLTQEQETALKAYRSRLSGMDLYRRVCRRLRRIRRIQTAYNKAKHAGGGLSPFAVRPALALRASPSGTAGLHREGSSHIISHQRMSHAEERRLSVQYLANQKPPSYLQSVFSI